MRYIITSVVATLLAQPALAEVPRVVTDFAPAAGLVATVMGDLGQPEMLLGQGANAHDFQLRPSQSASLQDADLVVWIGPRMSPWLDRVLTGFGDLRQMRLLDVPGTHLQDFGDTAAHDHDHDHDPAPAGDDHDDHDDHAHEGLDPHAWLDPSNGALWLDAIAAELARLDPDHAADYAANAARGRAEIAAADARIAARLGPVQGQPFVVFHDAYGYFAAHYGLTVAGSVSLGDATAPGAAHLRALQDQAGASARCLFPETVHDPKLLVQMAEATGLRLGGALDPEGMAQGGGAGAYTGTLEALADTLATCLSGK